MKPITKTISLLLIVGLIMTGCGKDKPTGPGPNPGPTPGPGPNPGAPAIVLSPSALTSFSAAQGGANPAAKTVSVTNGGGGSLAGLAASVSYPSGQASGWLSASMSQSTAPATLTLSATTGNLAAGSYAATVKVSATGCSAKSLTVNLSVGTTNQPKIVLSKTSVSFSTMVGRSISLSETVKITNGGGGVLSGLNASMTYVSGPQNGWGSVSMTPNGNGASLEINVATAGLPAGDYEARVNISSLTASNSPQYVTVLLTVAGLQTGAIRVTTSTTGSNPLGYVVTCTVAGGVVRTANINANGYVIFGSLLPGSHTVTLTAIPANFTVSGANPRTVTVTAGNTTDVRFDVILRQDPRQITLINQMSTGLNIHDIVQIKVASTQNGVFTRSDVLTDDPATCMRYPGDSVAPGGSETVDITVPDYYVYIGIGIWDMNNFQCSSSTPFFKRTFFTDLNWDTYYVWTVVRVTDHQSSNWNWTISGSYLNGSLKVTPAGSADIPFNVTSYNPIP